MLKYGQEDPMEIEMSKKLYKLDPNQNYFIYLYPEECEMVDMYDIQKCEYYKKRKGMKHIGRFMKYGGVNLQEYSSDLKKFGLYPKLNQILKWFVKMVYALKILHDNNILHRDIKNLNMIILKDDIHLIDFGYVKIVNPKSKKNAEIFRGYGLYSIYPPFILMDETHAIRMDDIKDIKSYFDRNGVSCYDENESRCLKALHYLKLQKPGTEDYLEDIMNKYIFKVDIWCLANAFFRSLYTPFNSQFIKEDPGLTKKFREILIKMVHPDPREQADLPFVIDYIRKNFSGIGESIFTESMVVKLEDLKEEKSKEKSPETMEYKIAKQVNQYCREHLNDKKCIAYLDKDDDTLYYFTVDQFMNVKDLSINPLNPSKILSNEFVNQLRKLIQERRASMTDVFH